MDETKRCPRCKTTKPIADFYLNPARLDGLSSWCVSCWTKSGRETRERRRQELLAIFGSKCERCGFDDWRALEVDHVAGGGGVERKTVHAHTNAFITRVKAHRSEYQLLCANCHRIKMHEEAEWQGNQVERRIPTVDRVKAPYVGRGNSVTGKAALVHAPEEQSRRSRKRWDTMTPEQRQAQSDKMRSAATGRRLVTDPNTGVRRWAHPGDPDYPTASAPCRAPSAKLRPDR